MQLSVQFRVLVHLFSYFLSKISLCLRSVSVPNRNQTSDPLKDLLRFQIYCWLFNFIFSQTSQEINPLLRNHFCRSRAAEKLKQSPSKLQRSKVLPGKARVPLASGLLQRDFHWGLILQSQHIHAQYHRYQKCSSYLCGLCNSFQPGVVRGALSEENSQKVPPTTPEAQLCPQPSPAGQWLSLKLLL